MILVDGSSASRTTNHLETSDVLDVYTVSSSDRSTVTLNILPDDVLLQIFHLDRLTYLDGLNALDRLSGVRPYWRWDRLVHVCRRWRSIVFASPNFLDLKLVFGPTTPVELAGIWPPLPIIIGSRHGLCTFEGYEFDAAIAHHPVCEIDLTLTRSQLQRLAPAMQKPFPALIHLDLSCYGCRGTSPALPDGFLGGSSPRLQSLALNRIPFPALPKFLLSATHLVRLSLGNIPGYMSPQVMATVLAVLADLEYLNIQIECLPVSRPEKESGLPPLLTRAVLPALSKVVFLGDSKYLEDLVAWIDAPLLDSIYIRFFYQPIFDTAQLAQFMRRATRFQEVNEAHLSFYRSRIQIESHTPTHILDERSGFSIACEDVDWELSYLEQVFTSFSPSVHMMEYLYIHGSRCVLSEEQEGIEITQWLEVLHPFTAVKNLYIIKEFAECIAPALQDLVGEGVRDVLPALESLFLEELGPSGPIQEGIREFVASRQLSGCLVTVSLWEIDHKQGFLSF